MKFVIFHIIFQTFLTNIVILIYIPVGDGSRRQVRVTSPEDLLFCDSEHRGKSGKALDSDR